MFQGKRSWFLEEKKRKREEQNKTFRKINNELLLRTLHIGPVTKAFFNVSPHLTFLSHRLCLMSFTSEYGWGICYIRHEKYTGGNMETKENKTRYLANIFLIWAIKQISIRWPSGVHLFILVGISKWHRLNDLKNRSSYSHSCGSSKSGMEVLGCLLPWSVDAFFHVFAWSSLCTFFCPLYRFVSSIGAFPSWKRMAWEKWVKVLRAEDWAVDSFLSQAG